MKSIKWILKLILDKQIDMRVRLLNGVLSCAVIADIVCIIANLFNHTSGNLINISLLIVICTSLVLSCFFNKTRASAILLIIMSNLVLMPVMYFYQGGYKSGMPIWMVFCSLCALLMIRGVVGVILFLAGLIASGACILIGFFKPETVSWLSEKIIFIDILQSLIIVTLLLGGIIIFYLNTYDRQKKELEEKSRALEEALEQTKKADKAKSDFLAHMSHEIRTPINAVLGMDELILRETKEADTLEYAGNIKRSGQSLLSLINDILDLSKIESGKMEINPEVYSFSSMLGDVYNLIITRANEKNLRVVFEVDSTIPSKLKGDEIRIRQIITNLLTNAIKYTAEGEVNLKADFSKISENQIQLVVKVSDTGVGISEENITKMFDSFNRVDEKKYRSIEGTGLGLSISRELVSLMDGEISVKSDPGKGSCFTVCIPQEIIDEREMGIFQIENPYTHINSKSLAVFPDKKVLVVDDVMMNLKVMAGLLKKTEISVDLALSGEECLKKICQSKYDLIFLDHMMPEMDGVETFKKMKKLEGNLNGSVPVVMLTANAVLGAKEDYLDSGFSDYLSKPIKYSELEEMLKKFLCDSCK